MRSTQMAGCSQIVGYRACVMLSKNLTDQNSLASIINDKHPNVHGWVIVICLCFPNHTTIYCMTGNSLQLIHVCHKKIIFILLRFGNDVVYQNYQMT